MPVLPEELTKRLDGCVDQCDEDAGVIFTDL